MKNLALTFLLVFVSVATAKAAPKTIEVAEEIVEPKHSNKKEFSYESSPHGVCKVLGYDYGVDGSITTKEGTFNAVKVNDTGRIIGGGRDYAIWKVTCVNNIPAPSEEVEIDPKNTQKTKITSEEVVKRLPMACVYVGLWKEINANQLPDVSQGVKDYVNALIPILRGTFKSLENMDCSKEITKEEIAEAALKLSKEIATKEAAVSQEARSSKKHKPDNKSKPKDGHTERGVRF